MLQGNVLRNKMNKSSFIQDEDNLFKKAPTLVRRVSDLFKDGTYSGPPSLFSQKIRHCCQNLNLLPYLLYSFENSKSHPIAKKVNLCFDLIVKNFVQQLLFMYTSIRRTALHNIQSKSVITVTTEIKEQKSTVEVNNARARLCNFRKQKPKQIPIYLVLAIYLAPVVLAVQILGLFNLLILGKYTPGFIFLFSSLLFLGLISIKIMLFNAVEVRRTRRERREKSKKE